MKLNILPSKGGGKMFPAFDYNHEKMSTETDAIMGRAIKVMMTVRMNLPAILTRVM